MEKFGLYALRPSRKRLQPGDALVMRFVVTREYLFGRVIDTNAVFPLSGERGAILVYVYCHRSPDRSTPEQLSRSDLLLPPRITNTLGWSRGYFETVEHRELAAADTLAQHCFRTATGNLLDENGTVVNRECSHPIGNWGVDSYGSIYYEASKALDIPVLAD